MTTDRSRMRLGVIASHPVHYFVPLYECIASSGVDLQVAFLSDAVMISSGFFDADFNRHIFWDANLLSGYDWVTLVPGKTRIGSTSPKDLAKVVRATSRWIDEFRPDVVLVPGWSPEYLIVIWILHRRGVPIILRPEARVPLSPHWLRRKISDFVRRAVVSRSRAGAAIGTSAYNELRRLGFTTESLFWSPYSVAMRIPDEPPMKSVMKKNLAIDTHVLVYTYVGKLASYKKVDRLLAAFAILHSTVQDSLLLIVGDGIEKDSLQLLAEELGISNSIRWMGFLGQQELPSVFNASDVFCLFSEETWGLVVNEAMSYGLPVVVSLEAGCSADLVAQGVTGFQVNTTRPVESAKALEALQDPTLRSHLGSNSKSLIHEFSISHSASGILEAARYATTMKNLRD